jgi:stress-induced morphogen
MTYRPRYCIFITELETLVASVYWSVAECVVTLDINNLIMYSVCFQARDVIPTITSAAAADIEIKEESLMEIKPEMNFYEVDDDYSQTAMGQNDLDDADNQESTSDLKPFESSKPSKKCTVVPSVRRQETKNEDSDSVDDLTVEVSNGDTDGDEFVPLINLKQRSGVKRKSTSLKSKNSKRRSTKKTILQTVLEDNPSEEVQCYLCSEMMAKGQVHKHIKETHGRIRINSSTMFGAKRPYKCHTCNASLKQELGKTWHICVSLMSRVKADKDGGPSMKYSTKCDTCDIVFKSKEKYLTHIGIET